MTQYGSPDVTITYDGDDMTPFVLTINGIKIEDLMQDSQPFGAVWNAVSPTGTKKIDDIMFGGHFDDVANGPKANWDTGGTTPAPGDVPKTLVITVGGTNTITIPVHPAIFEIKMTRNNIHEYNATLKKGTGDVTIAP
jgi:hypothetical protein